MEAFELGLEDRCVIVTGAAGGIGRSVAAGFAQHRARVLLLDRDISAIEEVRSALPEPDRHIGMAVDLADLDAHQGIVERCESELGGLDALVHLAAVLRRQFDIDEITAEDWDAQHGTNLRASFFLNRSVAQSFQRRRIKGRLINFTSQGWWTGGYGGSVVYAASKGGLVSMCRGLARIYAPDGITVNTISPGAADTPMARGGQSDEKMAEFVSMIPLGRMAHPDEVAGAALFLASDLAGYITGATINVSGGQLMY